MKKNNKISFYLYIIIPVVALVLFFSGRALLQKSDETTYMTASWIYNYADIAEISTSSDVIALIHINKLLRETEQSGIPASTFEAEVLTAVHGCSEGDILPIYQTGSVKNHIEVIDDPLLASGEEFLVFLRQNEDGTFTMLSGPQGRLMYKNGVLNSMQVVNKRVQSNNTSMNIKITNANADELISQIKDILQE